MVHFFVFYCIWQLSLIAYEIIQSSAPENPKDNILCTEVMHSVKSVRIRRYSGLHFHAFGLNTDQNNSKYGDFSRSDDDT